MNKEKALIFGVGDLFKQCSHYIIDRFEIIGYIDNYKCGCYIEDCLIDSVEKINDYQYDVIIIATTPEYAYPMRLQLEAMGISVDKMRFTEPSGTAPYRIDPLFFKNELTILEKKKLFSENVERIIWELNSHCNRRCWFCPNSFIDRHSHNVDMDEKLFVSILEDLTAINYSGDICFSLYNEPMSSKKLCERIKTIRQALPNCFLYIFSNGDYLNEKLLESLYSSGLNLLKIDIYDDANDMNSFDMEASRRKCRQFMDRLSIDGELVGDNEYFQVSTQYKDMLLEIFSQRMNWVASNRCESLPCDLPIPKITSHPYICTKTFISFHIDYRGGVWPCPNYHCDFPDHAQFCVGDMNIQSIFDAYTGEKMQNYRKCNFFERNTLPCRSCRWNFYSFIANRFDRPFRDRPLQRNFWNGGK